MNINNLFNVSGKTVVVTGGSRGIGEMITAGFLANGAKVYASFIEQLSVDFNEYMPKIHA